MIGVAGRCVEAARTLLHLFYPPHCFSCHAPTGDGRQHLCATCLQRAPRLSGTPCTQCGAAFAGVIAGEGFRCPACRASPPAFDAAIASRRFDGVVREAIHAFKYERRFHLRYPLAAWLLEGWGSVAGKLPFDAVVPVPLHPARERDRGFNQAEVLASFLSQESDLPLLTPLRRTRYTPSQTDLGREERMENLRNAFDLEQSANVRELHLILVDDVLTTGSTVNAAAKCLRKGGAASVTVMTVARS